VLRPDEDASDQGRVFDGGPESLTNGDSRWWKEGVFYQIYPRSFADSNGDGIGDLRGVIEHLDYLSWLGIDGIWLSPTMESPNDDWGYDVSDYKSVHPDLGTLGDLDDLITNASSRGIRVLLDFVPNHTSARHSWFLDARSSRSAEHRDWYVWADPKPDGSPPNNWLSVFGGSAWEYDERTGQYYLHNFLDTQPDLNWWNDEVRDAMDDVLSFWYGRGVAGFRIDVVHGVVKDKDLRDNLPATENDDVRTQALGQVPLYNMNQPGVHDVIRRWRKLSETQDPPRILVGETFLLDLAQVAKYYGKGDELHLAFNFPFVFAAFEPEALREVVELTESILDPLAWPVWTGSNHDVLRLATRWCKRDERRIRLALMMLLTLRGTPFLYFGDEIGLPNTRLRPEELKDPVGKRSWTNDLGRDPGRTPMHWNDESGAGFTRPGVTPWLSFGDFQRINVKTQKNDPTSILTLTRSLIALRRRLSDLNAGDYESLTSPPGVWTYRRGAGTVVALNFSEDEVNLDLRGKILLATVADEVESNDTLLLAPRTGAILDTQRP
jgi:alpha-glucosidase